MGRSDELDSLRWRWLRWRNGLLGSPRFQKLMERLPFTRPVARRRAGQLFDLIAGFTYTQALLATVNSGLLDRLAERPASLDDVIATTGLSEPAAERLVRAASAIDLAEEIEPGWWTLGEQGAALVGNEGARAMIEHHELLYRDLADPLALLRQDRGEATELSRFWAYEGDGDAAPYSRLMAASQHLVTQQVLPAYDFGKHSSLLDVGGGHGAFARAVAEKHPGLRIGIFDRLPVIEGAGGNIAELDDRLSLHPGDFFADPLPHGYDAISLVRILHDHDDDKALALLRNVREALEPGGTVIIAEPMADASGAKRMGDAYFGLYLWAMNSGRPRRARDYEAMLDSVGFSRHRCIATRQPIIASMFVATT